MNYKRLHPWKVKINYAIKIQEALRKEIVLGAKCKVIKKIAGVDVAFFADQAKAAICIFSFPDLNIIETKTAVKTVTFPYVPGLLTFREGPAILKAFKNVKNSPDIVLFDGQGICHPRRMGIATHLGIVLDTPSIGCAKTYLCGDYKMPQKVRGAYSLIKDGHTGKVLGAVLCTRNKTRPVFVSCGYKTTLEQARQLILELTPKFRIPEPLRWAHRLAKGEKGYQLQNVKPMLK